MLNLSKLINHFGDKAMHLALDWVSRGVASLESDSNGNTYIRFIGFGKNKFLEELNKK